MRLFVSVEIPDELKKKISALADEIMQDGIVPVKPENMHLTLRFIGETEDLEKIQDKLKDVKFSSFDCICRAVGVFPSRNYIRVVWAGIESSGKLEDLAKNIHESLEGVPGDNRFSAHITIARVKRKIDLNAFLEKHESDEFGSFNVSGFNLMQSILQSGGPEYSVMASFDSEDKK